MKLQLFRNCAADSSMADNLRLFRHLLLALYYSCVQIHLPELVFPQIGFGSACRLR